VLRQALSPEHGSIPILTVQQKKKKNGYIGVHNPGPPSPGPQQPLTDPGLGFNH
jgi:hypothetical protein